MTKNDNGYVALIADAVASRTLAPRARARLQSDVRASLGDLNRRWRRAIAAKFAVTRGDEIEGLLGNAAPVWDIAHWIRLKVAEADWVIACGRGAITTPLAPTAPEVDGPCFHAARGALDTAKRDRLVFAFGGFEPAVAAFAGYYSALYWSWTRRQRQAANYLRYYADTLGSLKLAQSMDIHPTGLSHLRRRMAWPLVEAGDKMFRDAIAPGEGS